MAIVVKPAIFIKSFGCQVQQPQEPEYFTIAILPKIAQEADAIVVEFCNLEDMFQSKLMGVKNEHEKFLLNWKDAKNLCYSILKAAAEIGDEASLKCIEIIDNEKK